MNRVDLEVLGLAVEDYYGLWELAVQVPVGRERLASSVQRLLEANLIEWFYRRSDLAEALVVPSGTPTASLLDDDALWTAPSATENNG